MPAMIRLLVMVPMESFDGAEEEEGLAEEREAVAEMAGRAERMAEREDVVEGESSSVV